MCSPTSKSGAAITYYVPRSASPHGQVMPFPQVCSGDRVAIKDASLHIALFLGVQCIGFVDIVTKRNVVVEMPDA